MAENRTEIDETVNLLPTGKAHVSFSEVSNWVGCSWSHKLKQVNKIDLDKQNWGSSFGTAIHAAHEHFIRTHEMKPEIALDLIKKSFEEGQFKDREGELLDVNVFLQQARNILSTIPTFYDETFKNWKCIDAEHELYEPIEGHPYFFKGFIDAIISCDWRGKRVIFMIDAKTSGWGWSAEKRSDELTKAQLILYRNYWAKKTGTDPKNIRLGFVILKRTAKPGNNCELITVSVGNVTTGRALNVINNMIASMDRKMFLKNKTSCMFCPYKMTEHCTGTNCV